MRGLFDKLLSFCLGKLFFRINLLKLFLKIHGKDRNDIFMVLL